MKNKVIILSVLAILCISCGSSQSEDNKFYTKVDREFGAVKNVEPYSINDTKTISETEYFKFHGRHFTNSTYNAEFFSWSNSGFEVTFVGTTLEAYLLTTNANSDESRPYLGVCIDNNYDPSSATPIQLTNSDNSNCDGKEGEFFKHSHVVLAHGLENKEHTIRIYKRSEINFSKVAVKSVSTDGSFLPVKAKNLSLKMEFFGDSVTCGYAVESQDYYEKFSTRTENSMKSFANYCANYLNADVSLVSCGGYPIYKSKYATGLPDNIPAMFSNADNDWYIETPAQWDNANYIPDVVVIALGANDGSYLSDFKEGSYEYNLAISKYKSEYISFLDKILIAYPNTQIVVSSEILEIKSVYEEKMDEIVHEYNASHTLQHNLIRFSSNASNLSIDKTMPGEGHPNETMQHITGKQLAIKLSEALSFQIFDDGFSF